MSNPIPFRTITDLHAAYESGKATPTGLTRAFLAAARESKHNAYITLCEERALAQAQAAESELARHGGKVPAARPLLGVPLGIKDILVMDGVRTTCASKILDTYIPPYTATCVERLEAAGAVSVGKLNLDEFAMGGSNENSAYGRVLHPTHADRVPGGSSGGSATAVAAGLCHASLGTDTGGSVRLPASFCGIVGLKPTYGRISRYGVIAFASSLDQVGPMTHSVEDAARLLQVMAGPDVRDATCAARPAEDFLAASRAKPDFSRLKVGVPKEYFVDGVAKSVGGAVRETLGWLESQGAKLVPISLPHTKYSVAVYYIVAVSEASSNLARYDGVRFGPRPPAAASAQKLDEFYETVRSQFGAEVKRRIILGTFALSAGYADEYFARACKVRRLIARDFEEAFRQVDVIAGPVSPTEAYKLGAQTKDPLTMYLNDIFTIPANLAGLPGISVPCGKGEEGLPIGLHLVAPAFAEGQLLSVAHSVEKARSS